MPRDRKPLGLRLTEQDVLDQLPAMAAWEPPTQRPLPGPQATLVELKVKRERRP